MAVQKASVVDIFNYKPYTGNSIFQSQGQNLSLVKDAYSGKYYGSDTYNSVMASIKQAESYFTNIISRAESGGFSWEKQALLQAPTTQAGFSNVAALSPYEEAKLGLKNLEGKTFDASSYVQKPQMLDSFKNDPAGWNSYFESSYKNPRIAEANNSMSQRNSQDSPANGATGNQLIASNLDIRKEVGTGIGKESVGLNPFGKLDAGLNI
jgi:hypothetical protein